jgi:hypothetical protein
VSGGRVELSHDRLEWSGGRFGRRGGRPVTPPPAGGPKRASFHVAPVPLALLQCLALLAAFAIAQASELTVDKRSVAMDESFHAVVRLEGSFARADSVLLPLRNLSADGPPSTSSEFQFINGSSFRSKTFTFILHGNAPGPALVGPLVIHDADGRAETLPPVAVQVLPDFTAGSNDPSRILSELLATGRDPVFVVASPDRNSAWVGEQVVVTWYLYTALSLHDLHVVELPKLEDFWSEELDAHGEETRQVVVGRTVMQRAALRRVALFPLHAGPLTVGSLKTVAAVMKRSREPFDPFGLFEGSVVEVRQHSPAVIIDARSLPPGVAADAVGNFSMTCSRALQRAGGPVVLDVTVTGNGNLRSSPAPRFERAFPASVEVENRPITVAATADGVAMHRTWRFLLGPVASGRLNIPPLSLSVFRPLGGLTQIRCGGSSIGVTLAPSAGTPAAGAGRVASSAAGRLSHRFVLPAAGAVAALVLLAAWLLRRPKRASTRRWAAVESWLGSPRRAPRELIAALDESVRDAGRDPRSLISTPGELGDAYRSLVSLLSMLEHDRQVDDAERELARRAREFFALL